MKLVFLLFFVVLLVFLPSACAFVADLNAEPSVIVQGDSVVVYGFVTKYPSEVLQSVDLNVWDSNGNSMIVSGDCMPAYIDNNEDFGYGVVSGDADKNYHIEELISNGLVLVSASEPFDALAVGQFKNYVFSDFFVPGNSSRALKMVFRNDSNEALQTASINTKFVDLQDGQKGEFELFVFNAVVPAIPEFASIFIPVLVVFGIAFVVVKK